MNENAIIILAAGASTRLGTPKQLLKYEGKTLITRMAEAANEIAGKNVIVVTGNLSQEIEAELHAQTVQFVHNPDWEEGMGSSIVAGVAYMQDAFPEITGVIVAVCDQPFVNAEVFQLLISKADQDKIVASQYADTIGTPVFFPLRYFPDLLRLKGVEGAKKLVESHQSDVITVPFPLGSIDIDTPADYDNLLDS